MRDFAIYESFVGSDKLISSFFFFGLAAKKPSKEELFLMFGLGSAQVFRMAATVAVTLLGGSFAIGLVSSSVSESVTLYKKVRNHITNVHLDLLRNNSGLLVCCNIGPFKFVRLSNDLLSILS